MSDQRSSESDETKRDIPSFIEPRPPLILNPFMRPRPQKGTNLLELFEEDSESEEPELVQVYLRIKPCSVRSNLYEVKSDRCLITSVDTAPMGHGRRTQHNISKMYTFSHIFGPESDQKQIFEQVVKENLKKLPNGHNFTLLTYGASGSGKTYTLMGTVQAPGLVPRSLEYVFRVIDPVQQPLYKPVDGGAQKLEYYAQDYEIQFVRKLRQVSAPLRDKYRRMSVQLRNDLTTSNLDLSNRTRYYVWVSFVEIYNEAIYDLLSNSDRSKATSKLRIREDSHGNAYVKGATQAFVRTGEEAYDVLVAGKHNLQVAATGVHANSSRSHCIFTITMLTETEEGVRTSCVRLCDLAGCERQRHARNTGARMQESRAINSSLHVLERCLHMLRRKQRKVDATLVPYRESKLTRLLGAGLSGSAGEAVSMVVTLSPAPAYAHETRHVLALAAVAKDIHVNQTIAESSLESSNIPETTIEPSGELMRLRADNERLHFELHQAQTRIKELLAAMEEKQQETAKTMFEIVEEAKDMTRQYYEVQMQALRQDMREMQDEYESRLEVASAHANIMRDSHTEMGTPSRSLQRKIAQLMTEIAILQEKLNAEKLARARAEEELQHLRVCIDERDEKHEDDSGHNEEVMTLSDSEDEEADDVESDFCNESLEPTFKKEDINRSRMLQQSLINDSKMDTIHDISENLPSDSESVKNDTLKDLNDTQDVTIKDDDITDESNTTDVTQKDSTYIKDESNMTNNIDGSFVKNTQNDATYVRGVSNVTNKIDNALNSSTPEHIAIYDHIEGETNTVKKNNATNFRGTYAIINEDKKPAENIEVPVKKNNAADFRGTYAIKNEDKKPTENIEVPVNKNNAADFRGTYAIINEDQKPTENLEAPVKKNNVADFRSTYAIINEDKKPTENIEVPVNKNNAADFRGTYAIINDDKKPTENLEAPVKKNNAADFRGTYAIINEDKKPTESIEVLVKKNNSVNFRGTYAIINEDKKPTENIEVPKNMDRLSDSLKNARTSMEEKGRTLNKELEKNNEETVNRMTDKITNVIMDKLYMHKPKSGRNRDGSLAQFEELEKASQLVNPQQAVQETTEEFSNQKILKEKRKYFDDDDSESLLPKVNKNKTYFDNIDINIEKNKNLTEMNKDKNYFDNHDINIEKNKNLTEVRNLLDDERSPSIVKEDVTNNFEPSTIKKLLGESFSRQPDLLSSVTKISLPKKHASVDIFEGFDSPYFTKTAEVPKSADKTSVLLKESDVSLTTTKQQSKLLPEIIDVQITKNTDIETDVFVKPGDKNETLGCLDVSNSKPKEISIFAKCIEKGSLGSKVNNIETTRNSMENFTLKTEVVNKNKIENTVIKTERISIEQKEVTESKNNATSSDFTTNNTVEDFEQFFKEISTSRATEFELLVTSVNQSNVTISNIETNKNSEKPKYNLRHTKLDTSAGRKDFNDGKRDKSAENKTNGATKKDIAIIKTEVNEKNYITIDKNTTKDQSDTSVNKKGNIEEVLLESRAKCESKSKPKRNLRLRRRKNQPGDETEEKEKSEARNKAKLKDIVNLQKEFSDVTMDVPAPVKTVNDIESPENCEEENVPPSLGVQSCPSKSVTRSRRKLFTPRAEPLEESMAASGDSHERVRVPRPSYHRTRARRKL